MSSFYEFIYYGRGGLSDTLVCYLCTCEQCGNILIQGTCLKCNSGAGISFTYDTIPEYFNEVQIIPNPPPQSHFNIYLCQICESNSHYGYECVNPLIDHHCCYKCRNSLSDFFCHQCTCEFCGNGDHVGYNCPAQVPSIQTLPNFPQQYPCCEDCEDLLEAYQCQPSQYTVNHLFFNAHNDLLHSQNKLMEQLTSMCNKVGQYIQRKEEEKRIEEEQAAKAQNWKLPVCYDDDDDEERSIFMKDKIISGLPPYAAITPSLSTEEPDNSLSMGDEHLDTIPATESDEFIKSSVESLVPIPSESVCIPDNMCDVPFHDNSPPLDVSKDQFEDFSDSNDGSTSTDHDSFSIDNIEYVEASPPNSELVSSAVMEIVIPKVGGINDDILLTIKDDILREKLLNINLLIASIKALNDNPTPSSDFMTKSSSTSLNSFLEETNTFDNSLPEFKIFCFDLEEISSGSTTIHYDISLP
uniref:Uncharacterized protein n=1 Tax=Tanacetum cinerariifolium TaxID=118510 RepID=A0A6L2MNX2_TANCI|nr:hypothetical protein [Tanacetum cinerariifolium]